MSVSASAMGTWALFGLLASVLFSALALRYARWRQLLDLPGRRRSHSTPTPRGGGIAIVATLLLALPWLPWNGPWLPLIFALMLLAVAGIGWLDDHRPLSARSRITVHGLAAVAGVVLLFASFGNPVPGLPSWLLAVLAVFWLAGCINAWNFMDGSNGLVTSQCLWLALALAWVFWRMALAGQVAAWPWAVLALLLAVACAGFLPFNFPRAAIFLGDVGSGALGLTCGMLLLVAFWLEPGNFWLLLVLPAALLVDAGLTLLWRIVSGRRWYTAHREHLYQWLIRAGHSHARVALAYLGWNLLVILPLAVAITQWPAAAWALALGALGMAGLVWRLGKQSVRQRVRRKGSFR